MYAKQILAALAVVGIASAAKSSDPCTQDSFTINSQADISALGSCETLTGNVIIGNQTDASLDFSGVTSIKGDLTCLNNKLVTNIGSSTLKTISGAFHLQNLTTLTTLAFTSLTSTGSINWISLPALSQLTFTAGVTKADSIVISDTFLSSLEGLDVTSATTININNNRRLVEYVSPLGNLTGLLNINANGLNLQVSFPNLIWIANMTISNVSSLSVPSLTVVNGSMVFDSNFFSTFSAPNLTATRTGDIAFVSNGNLTNITMPALTSIGGGFQIANNELTKITGFPKLKSVGGAIKLRGNFTDVEFPSLNDVKGAFDLVSTGDITSSCTTLNKLAPSSQHGNGDIQGTYRCESNRSNSSTDTSTTTSSGGSNNDGNKGNAASGLGINALAVLGLAAVAGIAQLL